VGLRIGWYARNAVTTHPDIEVRTETTLEGIREDAIVVQKKNQFEGLKV
jgi:hypothetical protein